MVFGNFIVGGTLIIIGLIILTGRAAFLIAGYNTMTPGQKARCDIKKISRFLGCMLIICALILIVGGALSQWDVLPNTSIMISWGLFLVIILGGVAYINISKRFKVNVVQIDTDKLLKNRGAKTVMIAGLAILIIVGVFIAYILVASGKPPVYTVSDTSLEISGMYGETVMISDIRYMELNDNLPTGLIRTNGAELGNMFKGNFESNDTKMRMFVDASKPPFIFLHTSKGMIVLNEQSSDKTKALYHELEDKISALGIASKKTP